MEALRAGIALGIIGGIGTALLLPPFIGLTRSRQYVREEALPGHRAKEGTPTMGGIVPLGLLLLLTLPGVALGVRLSREAFAVLLAAAGGGLVGLLDDLISQLRRRSLGLKVGQKLLLQLLASVPLWFLLGGDTSLSVPFSRLEIRLHPGAYFPLLSLAFMGTVNGMNLVDGLDGLAAGVCAVLLSTLCPLLSGHGDLLFLSLLGLGVTLGFLWRNTYPAEVFLGDVGAMGLGGLIFGLFAAGGEVLLLPLSGGLLVIESLSVIVQVGAFKLKGVRVFKMSPLHHHLEEGEVPWAHLIPSPNWPEPKVAVRLWLLSLLFSLLGLLAALP